MRTYNDQHVKRCRMKIWTAILCIACGSVVAAWGQAARDYTAGFERLFMLGLPDVSDAEYVNLSLQGHHRHLGRDWQWRRLELKGNAWLLGTDEEGIGRYLFNDGRIVNVYEPAHLQRLQREEAQAASQRPSRQPLGMNELRLSGTATPADLAEDLQKALARIRGEVDDDAQRSLRRHELDSIGGRLFVFAALAHRHGLEAEANEVVDALFAVAPEPRDVILNGLDHMANQKYKDLYHAWELDQKWEAFAVGLQDLIERFRAAWVLAPIADRVRADLENRLDDSGPPLLDGVSEEEQALAVELADAASPGMHRRHGFWIFPRSAWQQSFFWPGGIDDHPLSRIKAMGLDAVPLLLAMLDDRYPTRMSWEDVATGRTTYGSMRRRALDEQWTWRYFDSMQRPATRGDVARVLLAHLVREQDDTSVSGMPPEQVRAAIETWWERFGELDLEEIARIYLQEGLREQRAAAGLHLMHTDDHADMALVEQAIQSASDPVGIAELVMNYAHVKGADSRALVEPYIEELKAAMENLEGEQAWQRHGLQQVLNNLNTLLSDETLDAYLADVLAGDVRFDQQQFMRLTMTDRSPLRAMLGSMLNALVETGDLEVRSGVLHSLAFVQPWRLTSWNNRRTQQDEEPGAWMIDDFAEQWRNLLKRTDKIQEPFSLPVTMQSRIAQLLLQYQEGHEEARPHIAVMDGGGEQARAYYVEWAQRRVNDRDLGLPPLPSGDEVSIETRAEMTHRLLDADESKFTSILNDLSIDERLALYDVMNDDSDLREHLLAYANRVVWVGTARETDRLLALDELLSDQMLDATLVRAVLDGIKAELAEGRSLQVNIIRGPGLVRVAITYWPQPQYAVAAMRQGGDEPHVSGHLSSLEGNISGVRWPLVEPVTPQVSDDEMDLFDDMLLDLDEHVGHVRDEKREQFWAEIERLETGDVYPHHFWGIYLIGMPAIDNEEIP